MMQMMVRMMQTTAAASLAGPPGDTTPRRTGRDEASDAKLVENPAHPDWLEQS
jgi:hypothetical protein